MQEELRVEMEDCGIDVNGALSRMMGNEKLFFRVMKKFLEDNTYKNLIAKLEEEDYEEAFKSAHALKGVAANLGLNPIMDADSVIVEKLRNHNIEGIKEDVEKLTKEYQQIYAVLEKINTSFAMNF